MSPVWAPAGAMPPYEVSERARPPYTSPTPNGVARSADGRREGEPDALVLSRRGAGRAVAAEGDIVATLVGRDEDETMLAVQRPVRSVFHGVIACVASCNRHITSRRIHRNVIEKGTRRTVAASPSREGRSWLCEDAYGSIADTHLVLGPTR